MKYGHWLMNYRLTSPIRGSGCDWATFCPMQKQSRKKRYNRLSFDLGTVFTKGDILYNKLRPYLLKILVAPDDGICTPEIVPFRVYGGINPNYIVNYLKSPYVDNLINSITYGVKMPRVGTETMTSLLVPIPPLEEQRRIVERIKEVDSAVSAYDVAYQKNDTLNSAFPETLEKAILQEAVQVHQDPSDEPAEALLERIRAEKQRLIKEGKIKKDKHESASFRRNNSHYEKLDGVERCIDDELPFEIPENWSWPRIPTISLSISAGGDKPSVFSKVKTEKCSVPVSALQCIVSIYTTIITWFCSLQNLFLPQSRWVVFCGFERKIETKLEIKLFLWYNDYKAKEVFK